MDGFPIFAFIFFAIAASTIAGLSKTRRQSSLQKAADELGLRVDKKGLSGEINGYMVDTEYVSRGDKKGTRFRVRYPGWLGFNLRIATDQLGELRKLPLFGNLMPAQDIEIGSDLLDTKHLIQGDTYQVTQWFDTQRRDMVKRASQRFSSIEITDRQIETYFGRIISDPEELARMTRAVLFMAEVAYRTEGSDEIEAPTSIPGDPFGSDPETDVGGDEELIEVTIVDMDPISLDLDQVSIGTDDSVFADVFEDPVLPERAIPPEDVMFSAVPPEASADLLMPPSMDVESDLAPVTELSPAAGSVQDPAPEPEPDPLPEDPPPAVGAEIDAAAGSSDASLPDSVTTLSESLFGEYNPAYRIEELFSDGPKGATVTWRGRVENVGEFRRNRYLGEGPGVEVEMTGATLEDGRVTEVFVGLPMTDVERIRSGTEVTVRGTLTAVDAIMRRFYLTDGEIVGGS